MAYPKNAPDSENIYLGKGEFFFARDDDVTGLAGPMKHLGNVTSGETSTSDDIITKYTSMHAAATKYRETTRKRDITLGLVLDEFTPENIAMHQMGKVAVLVQAATAIVAESKFPSTVPGAYFKLNKLGPYTAVVVKFGATTGVLGTDYAWHNVKAGTIQILPTTILTGIVTVDYTPTAYTSLTGPKVVGGGSAGKIIGSAMFIGDPTTGPAMMVEFWRVSISPEGSFQLIGDDYGSFGATMAILDDSVNHPTPNNLYQTTYIPN